MSQNECFFLMDHMSRNPPSPEETRNSAFSVSKLSTDQMWFALLESSRSECFKHIHQITQKESTIRKQKEHNIVYMGILYWWFFQASYRWPSEMHFENSARDCLFRLGWGTGYFADKLSRSWFRFGPLRMMLAGWRGCRWFWKGSLDWSSFCPL